MELTIRARHTDSERDEILWFADQTGLVAFVIEEPLGIELTGVVPVSVVHVDCLVVTYYHCVAAHHVAEQRRILLSRMRNSKRHCMY